MTADRLLTVCDTLRLCRTMLYGLGDELTIAERYAISRIEDDLAHLKRLDREMRDGLTGDVMRDMEKAMGQGPGDDADDDFDSDLDDPERTQLYAPEQIAKVTLDESDPAFEVVVHGRT